jgi:hypothetical protein
MSTQDEDNEDAATSDADFRNQLNSSGYKPDADGMKWAVVQPKVLVAGAYKVIRTAAERARDAMGKGRG